MAVKERKGNADQREMIRNTGILFAITLIAGILLGFVYKLTEDPIRIQREKEVGEACRKVFADASAFRLLETYAPGQPLQEELAKEGVRIGRVFEADREDGSPAGYVVESTGQGGYEGDITILAGITLEGRLNGISILEIQETPGLGMNAEKELVPQFAGKTVESFTYTKTGSQSESEIDAISGATKTTAAVTKAVNGALRVVNEDMSGGGKYESGG